MLIRGNEICKVIIFKIEHTKQCIGETNKQENHLEEFHLKKVTQKHTGHLVLCT